MQMNAHEHKPGCNFITEHKYEATDIIGTDEETLRNRCKNWAHCVTDNKPMKKCKPFIITESNWFHN